MRNSNSINLQMTRVLGCQLTEYEEKKTYIHPKRFEGFNSPQAKLLEICGVGESIGQVLEMEALQRMYMCAKLCHVYCIILIKYYDIFNFKLNQICTHNHKLF